ncbi:protein LURP-one-related 14-like [Lycium ferocissimum]|uniref:protein LURP-one-related 14-like n=1 Tax=Lycium ferocissimum TaxID=112874 RepID=UPI002815C8E8|nr:protein LURP-one-related 14-like [Lycium ferocissimum]
MFKPEINFEVPLIPIVGDGFCFPYLVNLTVKKKVLGLSHIDIDVLDDTGNSLLQGDGKVWHLRKKKRIITDPAGLPLLTLREKTLSWRNTWKVYRGESSDRNDVLYTVKRSSTIQMKMQLDVFLASNVNGEICDFHVKGSFTNQSFKVYKRDTLIAEVKERFKLGSFFKGRENFELRVYPGVDYAFIVSILIIYNEIYGEG